MDAYGAMPLAYRVNLRMDAYGVASRGWSAKSFATAAPTAAPEEVAQSLVLHVALLQQSSRLRSVALRGFAPPPLAYRANLKMDAYGVALRS